jgi:apolipoprotein D and lipocalin family protein
VDRVDLQRYLGTWYEIARFPNRFQKQCVGDVTATYEQQGDGRLAVINRCRKADGTTDEARGVARIVDTATNAKLKVRFAPAFLTWLPAVWGDYWILDLAPDYSHVLVGTPDHKYLWILARTPALPDGTYTAILDAARRQGFDVGQLKPTPQQDR